MKLLPEFQIESISAIGKKNREDKIGLYPPEEKIVAHLPV
jgi:hypothetical protein